jgi:hypothetical protein
VSRDPLGLRAGLRVYGYVGDPGVASDPLGLAPAAGEGCGGAQRGSNNPKTRAAATTGQEAHRQIEAELEEQGLETEVTIYLKKSGKTVRKDALDPETNEVVIIKPDTPTGIRSAERRAALMASEGYEPRIIYYDPASPAFQPGSPTYIGPRT